MPEQGEKPRLRAKSRCLFAALYLLSVDLWKELWKYEFYMKFHVHDCFFVSLLSFM